ncbi:phosphate ABC transporter substrate-binding protein [Aquabacterium sp. A7-Y]|uniref:phosphate ABC transporter substrate-binding protein n=1 Tax=Aquabacterium sp. A7-Y TaxID=1349605 RepID=UPI00223E0B00|nr:phosphate ABC transporter substrate-binding protein [Aquabacterium sp. A7-Y]MCW7540990.1 phosphate ABC transporter substrate-binding protein [Aquabacterium sp. A7-Y]
MSSKRSAGSALTGACLAMLCLLGLPAASVDKTKLVLTGSSTVAPLAAEIGKRFEKQNPGVQVDVQSGGSSRGISDARQGLADIGMISRDLKGDEHDLQSFPIAFDGVCMIVHKSNPIQTLSKDQIVAMYTGRITNWSAVGGADRKISVVNKAEGRSTLELFLHHTGLTNRQIKAQVVIGDNEQGIKTVLGNPGAIAYVSIGSAEFSAEQGLSLKLLPMNGVAATTANVKDRRFPLTRVLNLVTKNQPSGLSKRFIDFARSDAVHDLVKDQYFVPLSATK